MDVQLLSPVFKYLFDQILERANAILHATGHLEPDKVLPLDDIRGKLFGTGESYHFNHADQPMAARKTIGNAMYIWMEETYPEKEWKARFKLSANFNPRVLQDLHQRYARIADQSDDKGHDNVLNIRKPYLDLYLAFIGEDSLTGMLKKTKISAADQNYQLQLLQSSSFEQEETKKDIDQVLYYRCYYLDAAPDHQPGELVSFEAIFKVRGQEAKAYFTNTPSGDNYQGDVVIKGGGKEALVTAFTEDKDFSRPLAIAIVHNCNAKFMELEVCVGFYVNISREATCYQGVVVFEKLADPSKTSRISGRQLLQYLRQPRRAIKEGGYLRVESFQHELARWQEENNQREVFTARFSNQYYKAILLCKTGQMGSLAGEEDRLETLYFHFDDEGNLRYKSQYQGHVKTYLGRITFHEGYQAVVELPTHVLGRYYIAIDLRNADADQRFLKGVYSGFTQDSMLAAGRVCFCPITKQEFQREEPVICYFSSPEGVDLRRQHPDLEFFFRGMLDKHLDSLDAFSDAAMSIKPSVPADMAGVFYYYRTRTIQGHIRKVKRYPLIIRPNGKIAVKVKAWDEEYEAEGYAEVNKDRVFMHLYKRDKYDGLAILFPNKRKMGQPMELMPAVYASTSKPQYLTAGRMYVLRLPSQNHEATFRNLQATTIDVDAPGAQLHFPEEVMIFDLLKGQINNYIAIRHVNEAFPRFLGRHLFCAACYQVRTHDLKEGLETLVIAIQEGGFRDIAALRSAFAADGDLYPIREDFRTYPARYDIRHSEQEDLRDYLHAIIREVFEPD